MLLHINDQQSSLLRVNVKIGHFRDILIIEGQILFIGLHNVVLLFIHYLIVHAVCRNHSKVGGIPPICERKTFRPWHTPLLAAPFYLSSALYFANI